MDDLKEVRRHTPGGVGAHAAVSRGERGDADQVAPRVRRSCPGASGRAQLRRGAGIRAAHKKSPAEAGHWMSGPSQMKSAVLIPDFAARVGSLPDYGLTSLPPPGSHACSRVPARPRRAFAFSHIAARSAPRWMEPAKPRAVGRAHVPIRCGLGPPRVPDGCCQSASHMRSSRPEAVSAATATRMAVIRSCSTSLATWRKGVRNMGGRDMPDI
jgi:hypothetical protein